MNSLFEEIVWTYSSEASFPKPKPELPKNFYSSSTFQGGKPGYVFTTREKGTGYYKDTVVRQRI